MAKTKRRIAEAKLHAADKIRQMEIEMQAEISRAETEADAIILEAERKCKAKRQEHN